MVTVGVFGLAVTGLVTWGAHHDYLQTQSRLLDLQTKQAADLLSAAGNAAGAPLAAAAQTVALTHGSPAAFLREVRPDVGGASGYLDAALWLDPSEGVTRVVATLGQRPAVDPDAPLVQRLADRSRAADTFSVALVRRGSSRRLAYLVAVRGSPYVVYAEQRLPTHGSTLRQNAAFSELGFAIYLGRTAAPSALLASADTTVPITGMTARATIPFGTSALTLVATPTGSLAGELAAALPWILAATLVVLTALVALVAQQLVHQRLLAESDAARSRGVSSALARMYTEQRSIAETLQHALLPVRNPAVDGMEVASRYVAGAAGAEVGGDWYSLLALDASRYGFVVGDVSGRGVEAAAVMAALRYTTRTLLLEGHGPGAVLERSEHHVIEQLRGHFATVLVGVGDASRGELVLASAGHLPPLLLDAAGPCRFLELQVGPPLGIGGWTYATTRLATRAGMTLIAYTDGLVERRGEHLDTGFARLAHAAAHGPRDLDALLTSVIAELIGDGAEDDVAVLALRYR